MTDLTLEKSAVGERDIQRLAKCIGKLARGQRAEGAHPGGHKLLVAGGGDGAEAGERRC